MKSFIQNALTTHELIANATVIRHSNNAFNTRLVSIYAPRRPFEVDGGILREVRTELRVIMILQIGVADHFQIDLDETRCLTKARVLLKVGDMLWPAERIGKLEIMT